MKRYVKIVSVTAITAVLLSVQIVIQPSFAQEGMPPQQAMPVKVMEAKPEKVEIWKDFSGRISAVDYIEIRPQVGGTITQVAFKDGQYVKKGDVLFIIDKRPYEAEVRKAKANLQTMKNQFILAEKELARAGELVKTDALSQRVFDERKSSRQIADSQVELAQAALDQAQINLDYATITAPVSGYTGRAEITLGNLVSPAASPVLTTMVSDTGVYADFEIDEKTYLQYVQNVKDEITIKLQIPSLDDKEYIGKIHAFDNKINPETGTLRARGFFTNGDKTLIPGMFVKVKMGTPSSEEKILIPDGLIGTDQNRKYVTVADAQNLVAFLPVELGEATEGRHVITSGLKGGEKIITDGLMMLRPGMPVSPIVEQEDGVSASASETPPTVAEENKVDVIKP